ncbi:MAG: UTP--glucose-1-phosphate uridylyltransferase GalU [Pseudomonadota bacterium]
MTRVTKAIFPVAGMGTRFLPATKSMPKEMLPLVDRPLIQYAVDEARAAGIEDFIFVTAKGKSALEDYFDASPVLEQELRRKNKPDLLAEVENATMASGAIAYIRQQEALGLGHAVHCAARLIGDEPFAVLLPDDVIAADKPCLAQMVEAYEAHGQGGSMVAAMEVAPAETASYGVIDPSDDLGTLVMAKGLVEKPKPEVAPSALAVIGRYILSPQVMKTLDDGKTGAGGEIQLTDAIAAQVGHAPVMGFRFQGTRFDCGSKSGFLRATIAYGLARDELAGDLAEYIRGLDLPGEAKQA